MFFCFATMVMIESPLVAEDVIIQGGGSVQIQGGSFSPGSGRPVRRSVEVAQRGKPPSGGPSKKEGDDKKEKEGEEKKDGEGDTPSKVIKRTEYTPPPVSEKVTIVPDADGKVKFSFQATPWPPVLNWLAEISSLNLDWQELPGDYLNLRTQQAYTPIEARDIINRHLLTRGYTLLQDGELLTVAKIASINPALVPRVSIDDLEKRMPHEFVKVSFELDWILVDDVVEQWKTLLSPNGKLSALSGVNRLEAMDSVVNLREIQRILSAEQEKSSTGKRLVREFKLKHVRANEIVNSLYGILGMDVPASASGGGGGGNMSYGMSQQIMQQLQRMQQQNQQRQQQQQQAGKGGGRVVTPPRLIVNSRENSILVHASPDKMEIIEQTIEAVDVPSERDHMLQNLDRMKVYHLSTLDPDPLVKILNEVGDLSPNTRIQVDKDNNSLIVYGELADHVTVQSLVDRLDGSTREFEVLQLRRLRAEAVAGTIEYMFGGEKEEESNSRRSRYSYYDPYGSSSSNDKKKNKRPFKIDADVENNRLLIWANESELKEVSSLLAKMGEIPAGENNSARTRILDISSDAEADKVLERIQKLWPDVGPNPIEIVPIRDVPTEPQEGAPVESKPMKSVPGEATPTVNAESHPLSPQANVVPLKSSKPEASRTELAVRQPLNVIRNAALQQGPVAEQPAATVESPASEPMPEKAHPLESSTVEKGLAPRGELPRGTAPGAAPPITIQRLPNGRLFIGSTDTRALDQLEQMISDVAPAAPEYKIFQIKHAWPFGLELLLDDIFEDDSDSDDDYGYWYYDRPPKNDTSTRLSDKKKLKIVSDDDSNTLLVQNATPTQLATIEELLKIYDQPESNDPKAVRETHVFYLEYSQAASMAETIKSVYRDLLSANDTALQTNNKGGDQKQQPPQKSYTYVLSSGDSNNPHEPIKFKGLLSIGVDEASNSLVVSSVSGLMEDITKLIETLDEAAKPTTKVQVMQMPASINLSTLKSRLDSTFGQTGARVNVSSTKAGKSQELRNEQQGSKKQRGE